jgi:hypothetical protein
MFKKKDEKELMSLFSFSGTWIFVCGLSIFFFFFSADSSKTDQVDADGIDLSSGVTNKLGDSWSTLISKEEWNEMGSVMS